MQFPIIGRFPDAEYHTPGAEILGQEVKHNEKVISIDKLLISHVFLSDLDEAMSHFDVRSKYSAQMGQTLAMTFDNHVMREMIIGGATATAITGDDTMAGDIITDADFDSATAADRWAAWETALFGAAQNFDEKFVPGPRFCIVTPETYYFLASYVSSNGFSGVNSDYAPGNGSYAEGQIIKIAGITLIPSPMLPVGDYSGEDYHAVDAQLVTGICFTPDAVGTVKLLDMSLQAEWDIRRQGTLMVARYAMGHGILQPQCVSIFKDTA